VTGNLAANFIAHAEYDVCGNSTAREVSMKHSRALPANRPEQEDVGGEKQIDCAGKFVCLRRLC